uniref:Protein MRP-126-like n=1 Tax=Cyanistes caeruleus TaxID=156563 RepID=A0A8C0UI50_CYACU
MRFGGRPGLCRSGHAWAGEEPGEWSSWSSAGLGTRPGHLSLQVTPLSHSARSWAPGSLEPPGLGVFSTLRSRDPRGASLHPSAGSWLSETISRGREERGFLLGEGQQSQEPLSELEKAMDVIIDVFHQYSRREGDRDTLSKKELKLMIEKQLANYLKHVKNKATIDQIMKDLDVNKDAQISFGEMMLLVTRVTCATHEHLHEVEDQQHQHHHQHHH